VLKKLRPSCVPDLSERYCYAINALLRRELRVAASDLRRAAALGTASLPPDVDIIRGSKSGKVRVAPRLSVLGPNIDPNS
jgi:hypothetical protein